MRDLLTIAAGKCDLFDAPNGCSTLLFWATGTL